MTASWLVLASTPPPDTKTGGEGPGLVAFLIVVALAVACWLLYRSLRTHLRRVDFEEQGQVAPPRVAGDEPPPDATPSV